MGDEGFESGAMELGLDAEAGDLACIHLDLLKSAQSDYMMIRGNASTDFMREMGGRRGLIGDIGNVITDMKNLGVESEQTVRALRAIEMSVATMQTAYGFYGVMRGLTMLKTGALEAEYLALATAIAPIPGVGQYAIWMSALAGGIVLGAFGGGYALGNYVKEQSISRDSIDITNPSDRRAVTATVGGM